MRPKREHATSNHQTYMVTSETWGRRSLFHVNRWAELFIKTLYHYRGNGYLLHEFVLMPDHFHLLLTPIISLERTVQYIKGGFSFRAKKELGSNMEVWQKGFQDHRIRDAEDYAVHVWYIHQNPAKAGLCNIPQDYQWSSVRAGVELDPAPQGLKPGNVADSSGAPEGAPCQNGAIPQGLKPQHMSDRFGAAKAAPFQDSPDVDDSSGAPEGAPCQNGAIPQGLKPRHLSDRFGAAKAAPFQDSQDVDDISGAPEGAPFQTIES